MTENSTEKEAVKKPSPVKVYGNTDGILKSLVSIWTESGVEIGVTFSVGGLIVSGTLISAKAYFTEMGAMFDKLSSDKPENTAIFFETLSNAMGVWAEEAEKHHKNEQRDGPNFVHLRNATFSSAGQELTNFSNKPHWRGKLTSVDGFFFGEVSPDPSGLTP